MDLEQRIAKLEEQVDILTRALTLTVVGAQPGVDWMSGRMADINARYSEGASDGA